MIELPLPILRQCIERCARQALDMVQTAIDIDIVSSKHLLDVPHDLGL